VAAGGFFSALSCPSLSASARPYDLRHAFASLLIHEGRLSIVEIAAQLGHNPTRCAWTRTHT
jgi:integrase